MRRCFLVLLLCLSVPLFARTDPFTYPLKTIVLDAGHGGKDNGASKSWPWGNVIEKEINLDVAQRVRIALETKHPELSVVMTRIDDHYVSLDERCRIAYGTTLPSKTSALFISIHVNSAASESASGFEVLTKLSSQQVSLYDASTPEGNISLYAPYSASELQALLDQRNKQVAQVFDDTLASRLPVSRNRGVKEQDVQVLWMTRMPALLLEMGFLSHDAEAHSLMDDAWRQAMAEAIVTAIEALL